MKIVKMKTHLSTLPIPSSLYLDISIYQTTLILELAVATE